MTQKKKVIVKNQRNPLISKISASDNVFMEGANLEKRHTVNFANEKITD